MHQVWGTETGTPWFRRGVECRTPQKDTGRLYPTSEWGRLHKDARLAHTDDVVSGGSLREFLSPSGSRHVDHTREHVSLFTELLSYMYPNTCHLSPNRPPSP